MSIPLVRSVSWHQLPLGAIIIEAPKLYGASIAELAGYPILTRSLRDLLINKYQFGPKARALIIDPDASIDTRKLLQQEQQIQRLMTVLPELNTLKKSLRTDWMNHPELKTGFCQQIMADQGPYTLHKNWARSFKSLAADQSAFVNQLWGNQLHTEPLGTLLGKILNQEIRIAPRGASLVDVGIDVSFSMENASKAEAALLVFNQLLPILAGRLCTSTWRIWLLSDSCTSYHFAPPSPFMDLDFKKVLKNHRISPGETRFGPFFRTILAPEQHYEHHLCMLFTDGICQDRDLSLRLLERMAQENIDYCQVVFHQQEEYRTGIITPFEDRSLDGVIRSEDLLSGEQAFIRNDDELTTYTEQKLREITDLAEAATGGQIIVAWNPLTASITLDVYEQYLLQLLQN